MTKQVETLGEVPREPGIYAMYGGEPVGRGWIAYVGTTGSLRRRLDQHVVARNSSVVTGTKAVGVNIEHVRYIDWWTSELLKDEDAWLAAELVAFDVLDPALRSRGRPRKNALVMAADEGFRQGVVDVLSRPPDGRLVLPTLAGLAGRVRELELRVAGLDERAN